MEVVQKHRIEDTQFPNNSNPVSEPYNFNRVYCTPVKLNAAMHWRSL